MLFKILHNDNNNNNIDSTDNNIYRDSLYSRFWIKQFACINILTITVPYEVLSLIYK